MRNTTVFTHLHGTLAQFDHFKQSDRVSAVSIMLSHAVCFPSPSGHSHSLVCWRFSRLLIGCLWGGKCQLDSKE